MMKMAGDRVTGGRRGCGRSQGWMLVGVGEVDGWMEPCRENSGEMAMESEARQEVVVRIG